MSWAQGLKPPRKRRANTIKAKVVVSEDRRALKSDQSEPHSCLNFLCRDACATYLDIISKGPNTIRPGALSAITSIGRLDIVFPSLGTYISFWQSSVRALKQLFHKSGTNVEPFLEFLLF